MHETIQKHKQVKMYEMPTFTELYIPLLTLIQNIFSKLKAIV